MTHHHCLIAFITIFELYFSQLSAYSLRFSTSFKWRDFSVSGYDYCPSALTSVRSFPLKKDQRLSPRSDATVLNLFNFNNRKNEQNGNGEIDRKQDTSEAKNRANPRGERKDNPDSSMEENKAQHKHQSFPTNVTSTLSNLPISWGSVVGGTILGAGLTFGTIFGPLFFDAGSSRSGPNPYDDITAPVILFQNILLDLENDYVDRVDPEKLFKTGVKAMLQSLDPYTEFEDLKGAREMRESVSGRYGGVGLVISNNKRPSTIATAGVLTKKDLKSVDGQVAEDADVADSDVDDDRNTGTGAAVTVDGIVNSNSDSQAKAQKGFGVNVVDAFEGYAFEAGMRPGDRILSVNGVDTTRMNVENVRDLLRGEPGTDIRVEYERNEYAGWNSRAAQQGSSEANEIGISNGRAETETGSGIIRGYAVLHRQAVRMSDVKLATMLGNPADGVGYINLSGFSSGAARDFRNAFLMLNYNAPNNHLKGLVLDLRGNPGGLLDQAVAIASMLVPEDSYIVSARDKTGQEIVYPSSMRPLRPPGMKLALLVNKGSASASEILSGAVQDLDAGIVVGPSTTYGKGLVQKIIPLPYDSALKYTIAKYYTPSGRCIQAVRYTGGRIDRLLASSATSTKQGLAQEPKDTTLPEGRPSSSRNKGTKRSYSGASINEGAVGTFDRAGAVKDLNNPVSPSPPPLSSSSPPPTPPPPPPSPPQSILPPSSGLLRLRCGIEMAEDYDPAKLFRSRIKITSTAIQQQEKEDEQQQQFPGTLGAFNPSSKFHGIFSVERRLPRPQPQLALLVGDGGQLQSQPDENDVDNQGGDDNPNNLPGGLYFDFKKDSSEDGATDIPDEDRRTFYTLNKQRPVRDGGGIEPDFKVEAIKVGPAESIAFSQGLYQEFATEYVKTHDVRPSLRHAADLERSSRNEDPRFIGGIIGGIDEYFVLNQDFTELQNQRDNILHSSDSSSVSGSGSAASSVSAPAVNQELQAIEEAALTGTLRYMLDGSPGNEQSKATTTTTSTISSPTRAAITSTTTSSILSGSRSDASGAGGEQVASAAQRDTLQRLSNSLRSSRVGLSSRVPQSFFWGNDRSSRDADRLFDDFKQYFIKKVDRQEVSIEAGLKPQILALEQSLKEAGLSDVLSGVEQLRPRIKEAILTDMDHNKKFIIDGLELAILNKELPDRLVIYHTVVQDPQVHAAVRLLRGERVKPIQPISSERSMPKIALANKSRSSGSSSDRDSSGKTAGSNDGPKSPKRSTAVPLRTPTVSQEASTSATIPAAPTTSTAKNNRLPAAERAGTGSPSSGSGDGLVSYDSLLRNL